MSARPQTSAQHETITLLTAPQQLSGLCLQGESITGGQRHIMQLAGSGSCSTVAQQQGVGV